MSQTKKEIRMEFNKQHYKRAVIDFKFDDYERFETARGEMSRPEFIKMLLDEHENKSGN